MTTDMLEQFSEALADRLADAATFTVAIRTGRRDRSAVSIAPPSLTASIPCRRKDGAIATTKPPTSS